MTTEEAIAVLKDAGFHVNQYKPKRYSQMYTIHRLATDAQLIALAEKLGKTEEGK